MMTALFWIFILCTISIGSIWGSIFLKKKYVEFLPITQFSIIIILYVAAILGQLQLGTYAIIALTAASYVFLIGYTIVRKRTKDILAILREPGFWIFIVSFLIIIICNKGKSPHLWDEFSCWATRVKDMCRLDTLYTVAAANVEVPAYPPATALIQYFYEKTHFLFVGGQKYIEDLLYIALQIFVLSILMPLCSKMKKSWSWNIVVAVFVFSIPVLFGMDGYNSLFVDPVIGILVGFLFVKLLNKDRTLFSLVEFSLAQYVLILVKDVTIYFCVVLYLLWIADDFAYYIRNNKNIGISEKIFWGAGDLISVFVFWGIKSAWNSELIKRGILEQTDGSLGAKYSSQVQVRDFIYGVFHGDQVVLDYCKAFAERYFNMGATNIQISCITILFIAIIITMYLLKKQNDQKLRKAILYVAAYVMIIGYFGVILLVYRFVFSQGEQEVLNCWERYIGTAILAIIYFLLNEWLKFYEEKETANLIVMLCLMLMIPAKTLISFADREMVYNSWKVRETYKTVADNVENVIDSGKHKILYMYHGETSENAYYLFQKLTYGLENSHISNFLYREEELYDPNERKEWYDDFDYLLIYGCTNELYQNIGGEYGKIDENGKCHLLKTIDGERLEVVF